MVATSQQITQLWNQFVEATTDYINQKIQTLTDRGISLQKHALELKDEYVKLWEESIAQGDYGELASETLNFIEALSDVGPVPSMAKVLSDVTGYDFSKPMSAFQVVQVLLGKHPSQLVRYGLSLHALPAFLDSYLETADNVLTVIEKLIEDESFLQLAETFDQSPSIVSNEVILKLRKVRFDLVKAIFGPTLKLTYVRLGQIDFDELLSMLSDEMIPASADAIKISTLNYVFSKIGDDINHFEKQLDFIRDMILYHSGIIETMDFGTITPSPAGQYMKNRILDIIKELMRIENDFVDLQSMKVFLEHYAKLVYLRGLLENVLILNSLGDKDEYDLSSYGAIVFTWNKNAFASLHIELKNVIKAVLLKSDLSGLPERVELARIHYDRTVNEFENIKTQIEQLWIPINWLKQIIESCINYLDQAKEDMAKKLLETGLADELQKLDELSATVEGYIFKAMDFLRPFLMMSPVAVFQFSSVAKEYERIMKDLETQAKNKLKKGRTIRKDRVDKIKQLISELKEDVEFFQKLTESAWGLMVMLGYTGGQNV